MSNVNITCRLCYNTFVVELEIQDFIDWCAGKLAQDAFPYLAVDQRELLITQTCGDCFDKMFPSENFEENSDTELTTAASTV